MKPGYKQTEVGVIPEDWEVLAVFALADKQKSRFDDGDWIEAEHITDKGIRLIQTRNIGVGEYVDKGAKKYIYESSFDRLRCKELCIGDLLICRLAEPAGRACILPDIGEKKVITSVDVTIFRPDEAKFDRGYLVQYFSTPQWFEAILEQVGGTTHKRISRSALGNIQVPLPPLPEQSAIATALSDVDALLAGLDKLIAKKRNLKQAAMQQLLTGKTRLPGFTGEWELKQLSDVLAIRHGRSQKKVEAADGEFPILATGGQIGFAIKSLYSKPSVLIGRKGTINQPQYMDAPFWTVDTLFYSELKDDNNAKFFYYRFCLIDWMQYNEASGVPSLNARTIENIEVACPPPKEQTAIMEVLGDMDAELEKLEQRREKARLLKQGMMQELLTGRTRLVQPIDPAFKLYDPNVAAELARQALEQAPALQNKGRINKAQPTSNVVPFPQPEAKPTERKANIHFQRSVFAAEIVERLHAEPTFGHVKFQKLIYLAEHLCKVDIGANYHRDAAGPYDNRALHSIDSQMEKNKWFQAKKLDKRYQYVPLAKHGDHKPYFDRYFANVSATFDKVIDTFKAATSEQCEIVATLYEAWRDLLAKNGSATDDAIIDQVLNHWHDAKRRIDEERWHTALSWMRANGFVPDGA